MSVLKEDLARAVNDASRHVTIRGKSVVIPLKFDEDGNPATADKLIFKRLSLTDLRFLKKWRESDWDVKKASKDSGLSDGQIERLVKKLACFREEDARVKALCEIPTPSWIAAKHVQNVYEGGVLEESEHKSLQELAKIEGAYKQAAISLTQNIYNLPELSAEDEAALKSIGDRIAMQKNAIPAQVVNDAA